MLAIGQGSKRSIQKQISEMGSNMIMIHPGGEMRGGVRQDASSMQTLKLENYETLRDECVFLSDISPNVSASGQLISGANNYPSSVSGVSIGYLNIRQLKIEQGEMFTEEDIRTAAKVCVIGSTIVENLFPDGADPIGKVIRCNQVPLRVIGILESKGYNSMGMDQDDVVLAPYSTVMKRLLAQTYLSGVFASALTEDMTEEAVDEITNILRREHKLKETDDDDFTIRTQQELSSMLNTTTDLMTTLTYQRNRSANVCRSQRNRHSVAIPYRISTDKYHRRIDWCNTGMRCIIHNKDSSQLAGICSTLECSPVVCSMYIHRCFLRMVSGKESRMS